MSGVVVKIEGIEQLKKKFGKLPETVTGELDAELHALSEEYVDKAVSLAPVDLGRLKGGISASHELLHHEVVSVVPYSAYVEFGTITRVKVPAGLEDFAIKFKGKGIRKTDGIYPHPFFFPHLPWARTEVQKRGEKVIKQALK